VSARSPEALGEAKSFGGSRGVGRDSFANPPENETPGVRIVGRVEHQVLRGKAFEILVELEISLEGGENHQ
jgi:hypothetical protein